MMMFNLYVQQNRWIVTALLAGTILTLLMVLTYSALWRPREMEQIQEKIRITGPVSFLHWLLSFMPWVLVLVILISFAYTLTHLTDAALHLPNW